jgi:hypothetical protein
MEETEMNWLFELLMNKFGVQTQAQRQAAAIQRVLGSDDWNDQDRKRMNPVPPATWRVL